MSLARSPKQYTGVRPINPPNVTYADRAPVVTDVAYVKGDLWEDLTGLASWQYAGAGVWIALGTGAVGGVVTLTGTTGGPISPIAGNISILGTAAAGLSFAGTAGTLTGNIAAATTSQRGTLATSTDAASVTGTSTAVAVTPASLTARLAAPGAIGGTTPGAATFTTLTSVGTASINASGAAVSTIGTGGTGAVNIGNATGNTAVTGSVDITVDMRCRSAFVDGDQGSGISATTGMTNVVNTTQGAGALTLLSTNGNSGTNAGFLKFYVGTTVVYVPYFDDIAP
jgi:hypothetical protein